jgi:hypothetical protein
MSGQSRREKIEAMLANEPSDIFLRYSLALEWLKESQFDRGLQILTELTEGSPPYVPAYFMAAQNLCQRGDIEAARGFLREGIEEARRQGDPHAAAEMSELLMSL